MQACCAVGCAAWGGSSATFDRPLDGEILDVMAHLDDTGSNALALSTIPFQRGTHRYTAVQMDDWLAVAVDGSVRANTTARNVTVGVKLITATGSAPVISFTGRPPGVDALRGALASFEVGAGVVTGASGNMHTNTVASATVTIPSITHGACSPCPVLFSNVSTIFTAEISGELTFQVGGVPPPHSPPALLKTETITVS